MKKSVFIFLLFSATFNIMKAQETPRFAVKLYNSVTSSSSYMSSGQKITVSEWINPSLAIQMRHKNPHFWSELELNQVKLYNRIQGYYQPSSSDYYSFMKRGVGITLRYELNYNFLSNLDKQPKFMPSLGIGIMPEFLSEKTTQISPQKQEPSRWNNLFIHTYITPRLTYNITSKWFLEASVPIQVHELAIMNLNPNLSQKKTYTYFNNNLFFNPVFTPRLGLGFRF